MLGEAGPILMFRILNCLQNEHDWRLVILAGVVCFLASLVAVSLYQQARAAESRARLLWILIAGLAGGGGVWATHFIAELAYRPGYPVGFDLSVTSLSLLAGILVTTAGLAIAAYVPHRLSAALGGAIVGVGVVCLHYIGMNALQIPATISWQPDLVMVSVLGAVGFGAGALEVASRSDRLPAMTLAACLFTLSILVLHFAGMAAVELIPDFMREVGSSYSLSPEALSLAIATAAASILGMCLVGALFNRRARRDIGEQNIKLDGALSNMNQGLCMFDAQNRLAVWNERYREMYNIDPDRIWAGCTIADLLAARIAAGTFPLDPAKYDAELRAALKQGKVYVINVELADGRCIDVVNQPVEHGGWVATHEDVTERRRAERELRQTRAFLDTIISNVPTPIVVKSLPDFRYLLVNKAAEKFFGRNADDFIGKTVHEVFEPDAAARVHEQDIKILQTGQETFTDEHSIVTPQGARVITSIRLPVMGLDGKPQYMIGVLHDLTDRKRDEARISYMAHHDTLTDLPNRAAFNQCLSAVSDLAKASGESFGLLVIDVDRFKTINDTFGTHAGDALLRQMASRLQEVCEGAFIARIGGDELAVISPTGPQPRTAEELARRLSAAAAEDFDVDGHPVNAGVTIGVAIFPTDGGDHATVQANAEAALFRAKSEARGSIRFFEPQMDQQLREKRGLQHDLRNALANGELELYYQPQAQMDGTVTGFEALVRWHHPRRGMVPPATFIPLAEESGLIIALGEWILRTACAEAASWPRPLRIAVNMSPVQFQHGDPANLVHTVLLETGLSANRLELEITEGVLIGDFSRAMSVLRRLKSMGVRIDMDDFGTGYSSLSYLQSFPFDKIKIDQVFVANLMQSPQSAAIVRAVIGLGQGLGLPVIAEGVETKEQRAFLAEAKCDGMQGYLIGRPQPIAHYADVVGRSTGKVVSLAVAS